MSGQVEKYFSKYRIWVEMNEKSSKSKELTLKQRKLLQYKNGAINSVLAEFKVLAD